MRGGIVLIIGIVSVLTAFFIGMAVQQSFIETMSRGPEAMMQNMQRIHSTSAFVNLLYYGGGLAILVGTALMVIQSMQQTRNSTSRYHAATMNASDTVHPNDLEEENRRLRDELARRERNE